MLSFTYPRLLHWSECDPAGIIFFPHYARWMTEGVDLMLLAVGIDPTARIDADSMCGLPSLGYTTRFHAPPRLHERLIHEIVVAAIGGASLTLRHRILRDGACLMDAEERRVWARMTPTAGTLQAQPIPAEMRAALSAATSLAG